MELKFGAGGRGDGGSRPGGGMDISWNYTLCLAC